MGESQDTEVRFDVLPIRGRQVLQQSIIDGVTVATQGIHCPSQERGSGVQPLKVKLISIIEMDYANL